MQTIKGSNPGREWTSVIVWLGAEEELKNWSYDYYTVRDGGIVLGTELTKGEAWTLYRQLAPAHPGLIIEQETGGGNSEASDSDTYTVWPPEAVELAVDWDAALDEDYEHNHPKPKYDESPEIRIEFPASGATYNEPKYGVYKYDEWPDSSVLAGQQRRQYLGTYETLEEAQAAYPTAEFTPGCGYRAPYLGHLPEED